ncbi:mechanosensitive ion channel family protein [Novosphingobium aquiterrae]|uniref:Mechanosensitive ion channel family protein n=1 Tax=Novosphingobium aquiterrae TaxID=624388 RepID=A0ABV6PI94_9SPHN
MILPKTLETRLKPPELPPETDLRRGRYGPAAHRGQSSADQSASNYPVFAGLQLDDGTAGSVAAIGPRATTLRTTDHVDVVVPNANLLGAKLTNWTRDRASRRVRVPFTVAYGTDKEIVKQAALEAARSVPFTLPDEGDRKSQVWLTGFGDSALEFALIVWPSLDAVKRPGSMMAAYYWALDDALRKNGVEIPFPQHDLRIRGLFGREGDAAIDAVSGRNSDVPPNSSTHVPAKSANDAADDIAEGGAL